VPGERPSRGAWLVPGIGLIAIPVMLLHDGLVTGEPFYWAQVAVRYSAATDAHVRTPAEVVGFLVGRAWAIGGLVVLAIAGIVRLWRPGTRAIVLGLLALGPGITAFLVLLAVRGILVADRYAAPIDLAIAFAAGIGFGWLWTAVRGGEPGDLEASRTGPAGVGLAVAVAVLVSGPYWAVDPSLRPSIRQSLALARDVDRSIGTLRATLAAARGDGAESGAAVTPLLYVPVAVRPRLVVDLDTDLGEVASTDPSRVDVGAGYPPAGSIVLHSLAGDPELPGFADLQVDQPREVGGVTVEPLLAAPAQGLWVDAIR
jgi:hypothetical protein